MIDVRATAVARMAVRRRRSRMMDVSNLGLDKTYLRSSREEEPELERSERAETGQPFL